MWCDLYKSGFRCSTAVVYVSKQLILIRLDLDIHVPVNVHIPVDVKYCRYKYNVPVDNDEEN